RRSANSNVRTRVSKDEDERLGAPSCSRRRASHSSLRPLAELGCAARLLSMRAGEAMARALRLRDASQRAFGGGAVALAPRRDAPQHEGDQDQPAAVRNGRLCFRSVIYSENSNHSVSAPLLPKIPITAMW